MGYGKANLLLIKGWQLGGSWMYIGPQLCNNGKTSCYIKKLYGFWSRLWLKTAPARLEVGTSWQIKAPGYSSPKCAYHQDEQQNLFPWINALPSVLHKRKPTAKLQVHKTHVFLQQRGYTNRKLLRIYKIWPRKMQINYWIKY